MIFLRNIMKRTKLLASIIGVILFSISLSSCATNKAQNCTLYGSTYQNASGEVVARFNKGQRKTNNTIEIYGSKAEKNKNGLVSIDNRGIVFNKTNTGYINEITIEISDESFESAKFFYGSNPFPIGNGQALTLGHNIINLKNENSGFFVIQNQGAQFSIDFISISYTKEEIANRTETLPEIHINTENRKNVTSVVDYVNCQIVTDEYKDGLSSQIKVRGNSTSNLIKSLIVSNLIKRPRSLAILNQRTISS